MIDKKEASIAMLGQPPGGGAEGNSVLTSGHSATGQRTGVYVTAMIYLVRNHTGKVECRMHD